MRTISTGEPSTLGTYLKIAKVFGENTERFIQDYIDKSPNGEDEEVIAEESQMLYLLTHIMASTKEVEPDDVTEYLERLGIVL